MRRNPDDFSEYTETPPYGNAPHAIDYSNPAYYHQPMPEFAPAIESYPDYANGPTILNSQSAAMMDEYRGPATLEGYTTDAGAEQREAAAHGKVETGKTRKGLLAKLSGIGIAIGALLLKLKGLLFLAKFGIAGLTALISIGLYALIFGWPFAIGLVALLFIHEMGHALVMKLKGIPIGGLIFVPFLGAAVFMRNMPKNAQDEAEVGIAGPIAGTIASGACLAFALLSPHMLTIWAPLAYFGFFMNLLNLVPVLPFDGGRVLAAIDRRIWILGFIGLLAFQIWEWIHGNASIFLLFFIIMAGTQLWARRHTPDTPETQHYYSVPIGTRIALSLLYFGLAAVLVLGMSISHGLIPLQRIG